MNLSKHFSLAELTFSQTAKRQKIDNTPGKPHIRNLNRLATTLEQVRELMGGKPIRITSGYRCQALNRAIGSKDSSQHIEGLAADFHVPGIPIDNIYCAIKSSAINFDQLINEYDSWVHISIPAPGEHHRNQAFKIA